MSTRTSTSTFTLGTALVAVLLLGSCGGDPNSPGVEYMPDMYRSPAIEAYVDFGQDPYNFTEEVAKEQRNRQSARLPVVGTIPFAADASKAQFNMPYPYADTPEGYEAAGANLKSPIAMTEVTVAEGKIIYEKFCMHCHGATGHGDGGVVKNGNYPVPPAYDGAQLKDLPEGKIFHSLTFGKNLAMGSHASQLNKEERWILVQYVKFLQNGGKMQRDGTVATAPVAAVN